MRTLGTTLARFRERTRLRLARITPTEAAIVALMVGGALGYNLAAGTGQARYDSLLNQVNDDIRTMCIRIEDWAKANPRGAQNSVRQHLARHVVSL